LEDIQLLRGFGKELCESVDNKLKLGIGVEASEKLIDADSKNKERISIILVFFVFHKIDSSLEKLVEVLHGENV
jgi:hypothetical protein